MQADIWDYLQSRLATGLRSSRLDPFPSSLHAEVRKLGGGAGIRSDAEMVEFLDALLAEAFYPPLDPYEFRGPIGSEHKWRYASAFQKAVRRNDASIVGVSSALNRCDSTYIWRRAPTIALEDVGLGDPWVCALVLHACRFSRLRKEYGIEDLSGFLGQIMGRAVKDRLSCDSFCLAYFDPRLAKVRAAVEDMASSERSEIYRSDHSPFAWRVAAGLALAGPRYGGDVFTGIGGSQQKIIEAMDGLAPYPIRWICHQYSKMAKDGMFVTMPLIWRQMMIEGQSETTCHQLPERTLVDGVLAATFDGYTRDGKRALAWFADNCGPVRQALRGEREKAKVLALAVFTCDSSLLDRSLTSPWATELYNENLEGEILAAGSSRERFVKLISAVSANLGTLHSLRRRAALRSAA